MNTCNYTSFFTAKAVNGGQNFYILEDQEGIEAFLYWQKLQVDATVQDITRNLVTPENWGQYEPICIKGIHHLAIWELSRGRAAPLTAHTKAFDLSSTHHRLPTSNQLLLPSHSGVGNKFLR